MENQRVKTVKEEKFNDKNKYEIIFEDDKTITLEGKGKIKVAVEA